MISSQQLNCQLQDLRIGFERSGSPTRMLQIILSLDIFYSSIRIGFESMRQTHTLINIILFCLTS